MRFAQVQFSWLDAAKLIAMVDHAIVKVIIFAHDQGFVKPADQFESFPAPEASCNDQVIIQISISFKPANACPVAPTRRPIRHSDNVVPLVFNGRDACFDNLRIQLEIAVYPVEIIAMCDLRPLIELCATLRAASDQPAISRRYFRRGIAAVIVYNNDFNLRIGLGLDRF